LNRNCKDNAYITAHRSLSETNPCGQTFGGTGLAGCDQLKRCVSARAVCECARESRYNSQTRQQTLFKPN